MSLFNRLLRSLGLIRDSQLTFQVNADIIPSLEKVMDREQRPPEDVVSELLSHAIADRQTAGDSLYFWEALTEREQDVVALTCLGYTNRDVARRMFISPNTVKTHMRNILQKFDLNSKSQLRYIFSDWDFSAWDT